MPTPIELCTVDAGVANTKCFDCLSRLEKRALSVYFLAQGVKAAGGTDYTDVNVLRKAVACFCVPSSRLDSFETGIFQFLAIVMGADQLTNMTIAEMRAAVKCSACDTGMMDDLRMEQLFLLCQWAQLLNVPCWVAREVYGWTNPKWLVFAAWLLNESPAWFRKLYLAEGRSFAAWIADKPRLKRIVRWFMDRVTT